MQYLNLFLAICWLLIGGGLLYWQEVMGHSSLRLPLGDRAISPGWLALLLALYNLVRFWGVRAANRQRRQREAEHLGKRMDRLSGSKADTTPVTPDPNFQFDEPAPTPLPTEPPGGRK
jgi:hypothetical protein